MAKVKRKEESEVSIVCNDPNHLPDVSKIYVGPGRVYTYQCPSCGNITEIHGPNIYYQRK